MIQEQVCAEQVKFKNKIRVTLRDAKTGEIVQQIEKDNLIVTAGKQLVLDIMAGTLAKLSYGAVGTSSTAAAAGDTQLGAETARQTITYSRSGTTGTYSVFFNTSEANATLAEVGFFGGAATAAANSGTLFNHIILSPTIVKTASYVLTIDLDVTLS